MASIPGRGAQVRLDGDAQKLARGAGATRLVDSLEQKAALERAGISADGYTPDGSTVTGQAAEDEALTPGGVVPDIGTVSAIATTAANTAATAKVAEIAVPLTGGTMTGALTVIAPTADNHPARRIDLASLPANAVVPTINADQGNTRIANAAAVQAMIERVQGRTDTLATLRARAVAAPAAGNFSLCFMQGYRVRGDGGEGLFTWDTNSTLDDDGGTVIQPTAIAAGSPGRWRRLTMGMPYNFLWFGAVAGNGAIDNKPFFDAALAACVRDRREGYIPPGDYTLSPITLPAAFHSVRCGGRDLTTLIRKSGVTARGAMIVPYHTQRSPKWTGFRLRGFASDNGAGIYVDDAVLYRRTSGVTASGSTSILLTTAATAALVGLYLNVAGAPSTTRVTAVSGNTITIDTATTAAIPNNTEIQFVVAPNAYINAIDLEDVLIDSMVGDGIYVGSGRSLAKMQNVTVSAAGQNGFNFFRGPDHRLRNVYAGDCVLAGLRYEAATDLSVNQFAFYNNGEGIHGELTNANPARFIDGSIDGSKTHGVNLVGYTFENTSELTLIRFSANSSSSPGTYSDIKVSGTRSVVVANNVFVSQGSATVKHVIECASMTGPLVVSGNSFEQPNRISYAVSPTNDYWSAPLLGAAKQFIAVTFAELTPTRATADPGRVVQVTDRTNRLATASASGGGTWTDVAGATFA